MMLQQYIIYLKEFNDKKNGRHKGKDLIFCKAVDGSYKM